MDLLRRLARERGRAVAIVTHDNRMLGYGDRLVKMEDGRVVADERQTVLQGAVA
jgi:putative ABC transport system ATP-binding protein